MRVCTHACAHVLACTYHSSMHMSAGPGRDQEGSKLLEAGVLGGFLQKEQHTLLTTELLFYHCHLSKMIYIFIYLCVYMSS